jgi:two-component system, OmpR family, phosphate regulon sensor histidine kinase PhoR
LGLIEFLTGLAIGLGCLVWWQQRYHQRLERLLRFFQGSMQQTSPPLERLGSAVEVQQQLSQVLLQKVACWEQIIYHAPLAYLQVDADNQFSWANRRACQLLGIDPQLVQPSARRLLLQVVRSYELHDLIERTRQEQQPQQQDWLYHPHLLSQRQGILQLPLRGYGLPLPAQQVGVFLEDRREAVSLREERDRWTSDVAHELKTPLTSIRLVAETLQTRIDPGLRSWIDRLLNETVRLSVLVQELLDLSRFTLNPNPELAHQPLDLVQLIQNAWSNLEPLARKQQVQLIYDGEPSCPLNGDETQLYRVLLNLLDNSIKYSPEGGSVTVRTSYPLSPTHLSLSGELSTQPWLCLEVIDAGPGFAPTDLPHVFERFYRADLARSHQSTTKLQGSGSGSGLGLAIVRQIVEAHGGSVTAANHPETGGAWLQVYLPLGLADGEVSLDRSQQQLMGNVG